MRKPDGYDEASAYTGETETLAPGGYVCKILDAKEEATRKKIPMLVLYFDIAEGDEKGFYRRLFDRQKERYGDDAKWKGVYRQPTEGKSLPFFKGVICSIEESNPGYKFTFDEATLKGKLFGGVFGREEYMSQKGDRRFTTKCVGVRTVAAVHEGIEPPADKLLEPQGTFGDYPPFTAVDDDELPF